MGQAQIGQHMLRGPKGLQEMLVEVVEKMFDYYDYGGMLF